MKFSFHPLFILLGLILIFLGRGILFLIYTLTLLAHEAGHAAAAKRAGYKLDTVHLMPYGARLSGDMCGIKPADEIVIALAGPLVNIAVVVLFTALWWVVPAAYPYTYEIVTANFVTALFNFLPIYPLDGGRIALALLSSKLSHSTASKIIRTTGAVMSGIFALLFAGSIFYGVNFSLITIALFFFAGAALGSGADGYVRLHNRAYRGEYFKRGLTVTELVFPLGVLPVEVLSKFKMNKYYRVTFLDDKLNPVFSLTEAEIEELCVADMFLPIGEKSKGLVKR